MLTKDKKSSIFMLRENNMKQIISCPICHKIIGKIEENGQMQKAYLWCRRCKKEIYIDNAKELKNMPESKK